MVCLWTTTKQHGNSPPSVSGSEHKKKEIYRYSAPYEWQLYGMNWSVRPDRRFRTAVRVGNLSKITVIKFVRFLLVSLAWPDPLGAAADAY